MESAEQQKQVARGLRVYSVEQLSEAYKTHKDKYGWDFSSERQFIENLFCQRFNFLLVVYSIFVAAAAATDNQTNLVIILSVGAVITFLVSLAIWRAYIKLKITLTILHRLPGHVFQYIAAETEALGLRALFGVNCVVGLVIPAFCCVTLVLGVIAACCGIINVSGKG